jgi:ankyrin repeat protein
LKNGAIGDPKQPPHEAALLKGHQKIAELLLNYKADVKQGSKGDNTGLTSKG